MRLHRAVVFAVALCTSAAIADPGRADPTLTSGIGLAH